MKTVEDILRHKGRDVITIAPDSSVKTALSLMSDRNIGALLVVNGDGRPQGIFSERDFARHMVDSSRAASEIKVRELMTRNLSAVSEERTIHECMALMTERRIRHLPVMKDGALAGMISIGDVVNAVIHEQEFLIDQLEHYISGSL